MNSSFRISVAVALLLILPLCSSISAADADGGGGSSLLEAPTEDILEGRTWRSCGVTQQCQPFALPDFANSPDVAINADSSGAYPDGDSSDFTAENSDGDSSDSSVLGPKGPGKSQDTSLPEPFQCLLSPSQ